MKLSLLSPIAPGKIGAWVCLIATLLLWSPMWAAAWEANQMDCCNGVQCPAHRHQPGKHSQHKMAEPVAQSGNESSMDCHRARTSESMRCSMSCCRDTQQVFAASIVFVMPAPAQVFTATLAAESPRVFAPQHVFASFEPLSPPPRSAASL